MAEGDIGAIIDSEQWKAIGCYAPFLTHLRDNLYLIAEGNGATVRTINIDYDGGIGAVIDTLILDAGLSSGAKYIRHVDGDVYAVAYVGALNVVVETFTCDAAGNLGGAVIDTEILAVSPANFSFYPFLLHATGNIYIVAYTDNADDGWIKILRINNDGSIDPFLDSWECEADRGRFPWLIHIEGDMYAIMISASASNRGKIRTFSVNAAGAITAANIAEWIFEGGANAMNGGCIVPISASDYTFALFWGGAANIGQMATCTITPNGWVNGAGGPGGPPIDTWTYDTFASHPMALVISGNEAGTGMIFCVGKGFNSGRQIVTIEILNDGTISKAFIDTLTLVAADWGQDFSLVRVSLPDEIIFAACYEDLTGGDTGEIDTFEVEGRITPVVQTDPATEVT